MNSVKCPKCNSDFSLDSIMKKQAEELLSSEKMKIISSIEAEKNALDKEKFSLQEEKNNFQQKIAAQLEIEKRQLSKDIRKSVEQSWQAKIDFLEEQAKESEERVKKAIEAELSFKAKESEVERRERELALTIKDQVDEKAKALQLEISKKYAEEYKNKDQEKDLQLSALRSQIVEWKQKAEQGSQQMQGEALELELEAALKKTFPIDIVEPVAKGANGADIIHDVIGTAGQRYGRIIWESKRTKNFSNSWISKLKTDRNEAKADVAILITEAMPEDHLKIIEIEGVWVVKPEFAVGVAYLLRNGLREVSRSLAISGARSEKAEVIFNYLTSATFKQRMETIVESFSTMREDLEKEKRVTQRSWKVRENQLENIFQASLGMYSDIQLVLGASTFQIPALEYGSSTGVE